MKNYKENDLGKLENFNETGKLKTPSPAKLWFKKAFKHIAVGAVSLGVVVGAVFGFAGCGHTNDPVKPGPEPGPEPDKPPIIVEDPTIKDVTFKNFIDDYKEEGVEFFNKYLKPQITTNTTDNFESLNFTPNLNDQLEEVSYAYIEKTGETARKFNVVNVSFSNPIEFEDIVNNTTEKLDSIVPIIKRDYSFEYDAKVNALKSDLANAVNFRFSQLYSSDYNKGVARIYNESVNSNNQREMNILQINDDNTVNNFYLRMVNLESDADMANSIKDPDTYDANHRRHTNNTYTIEGENIMYNPYKVEEYKEDVGPGKEDVYVKDMADLLQNYSTDVQQGLQSAKEKLGSTIKSNLPGYREENVLESKWDFDADDNGNITKINYIGTLQNTNTVTYFVASATPSSPINIKELKNTDIQTKLQDATNNATLNFEYNFNYTVSEQSQYQDLAKAVFTQEGMLEEGATYFISHPSPLTDSTLHEVQSITFVQVTKDGIKEISTIIQDGDLKSNVENNLYRKFASKSYELGGTTLDEKTQVTNTVKAHSFFNEVSGKYSIYDFGDENLF